MKIGEDLMGKLSAPQLVGNQIPKAVLDAAKQMHCVGGIKNPETGEVGKCNGNLFVDAFKLAYVSAIISPVGKETLLNANIGKICIRCGKVFNIEEWKKEPVITKKKDSKEKW